MTAMIFASESAVMPHYPIFVDLKNRPVLLIGAGKVAARKAESLLRAGARLRVVAQELSPSIARWLQQGRLEWTDTDFDAAYLADVFLVIAASNDELLNERVFRAAELRGKLCNSVDDPAACSYIVPAVIDRNPVQVAVSSGGSAPVLARLWRQKIELLLPRHLGAIAHLAGKWRSRIKQHLKKVADRRAFWEELFSSRFDVLAAQGQWDEAERELVRQLNGKPAAHGSVMLVGAGPGDAGLLTLNALQAIGAADVVLYDALISEDIRRLIRKDAEQICVGKRAGDHAVAQEETNRLLLHFARLGKRVVRLKGGDPFVFGRGGEEAQVLAEAGIAFRVVPGITAALGASACAGIPLTHRDLAQSAVFVTGHCRNDADPPEWESLARARQTLVIYMGTLKAAQIAANLIRHGRSATTPVAVISNGTLPDQEVRTGVLHDLPHLAQTAQRPALIVIGEVVALRYVLSGEKANNLREDLMPAA